MTGSVMFKLHQFHNLNICGFDESGLENEILNGAVDLLDFDGLDLDFDRYKDDVNCGPHEDFVK